MKKKESKFKSTIKKVCIILIVVFMLAISVLTMAYMPIAG